MEARITAHSQPYRLRERMEEAQIRHGTDVRVDLPGIRVMAFADSWFSSITGAFFNAPSSSREGEVFFCNMGRIKVHETLVDGDEHPLPNTVILDGLKVNESGVYDVLNALVRSNGDIRVFVDENTKIQPAHRVAIPQ